MKKILLAIAVLAVPSLFACPALRAQEVPTTQVSTTTGATRTAVTDAEIELMRKDIRSQRKQIIAANLQMTDTEAEKFWPVYDRYAADQKKAYDVHYGLLNDGRDGAQSDQAMDRGRHSEGAVACEVFPSV